MTSRQAQSPETSRVPSPTGRRILYGILGGTGQTVVAILVALVQLRLVMSYLPRDTAGSWFLFLSFGTYIAYFDLGISPTLSREISFLAGSPEREAANVDQRVADLIATCQRMFQSTAALVLLLATALGGVVLSTIAQEHRSTELGIAWLVFATGASLNILGGAAFAALYGTGHVATERLIRAATQLLGLAGTAICLALGYGIIALAAVWTVQNLIARLWGWGMLYRQHPRLKTIRGKATMAQARAIAGPSLKWAAMGLGAILILQTDNPIIAAMLGAAAIPPYEAVSKIIAALMTFSLLIVTSSTPFLSRAHAAGDHDAFRELLLRNVRIGMGVMVIFASYLAVFGDRIIDVWLGSGNFVGFPVLWTLLLMLVLEVHHVIHATATMSAGHLVFLVPALLSGVLKVALSLLLAGHLGLWGVALGTFLAQVVTNNWYAPYVTLRTFRIPFRDYARRALVPLGIVCAVMLGVSAGLRALTQGMRPLSVVALTLVPLMAVGAAAVNAMLVDEKERRQFLQIAAFWRR